MKYITVTAHILLMISACCRQSPECIEIFEERGCHKKSYKDIEISDDDFNRLIDVSIEKREVIYVRYHSGDKALLPLHKRLKEMRSDGINVVIFGDPPPRGLF